MPSRTYRTSGVDIGEANAFVEKIKPIAAATRRAGVLKGIGGFGAFFRAPFGRFKRPVLVSSADGVGTKLKSASAAGRLEGLGVDLVAMNVNDILTCGAEPLFFLDYLATGRLEAAQMVRVIKGIAAGCREAGCALVGGETAEMPGLYRNGDFDLAGFAVGVVEESRILGPARVRAGDALVGCASSGIHSNGFSLVRRIFTDRFIRNHAEEVLAPTRIYVKPILRLIARARVNAMAHITGGAFYDKLPRALPPGCGALVHAGSWRVPRVFEWLRRKGGVSAREMYRTFNMGVGFILVVPPSEVARTLKFLAKSGVESWAIGEVVKGEGVDIR